MYEEACENSPTAAGNCDTDQQSFKAYLARWMAATAKLCPWTTTTIMSLLATSASAAAQQCSGGTDGVTCGEHWTAKDAYDGNYGLGQQLSALSVIQSNLVTSAPVMVTNATGGTSQGNAAAGTGSRQNADGSTTLVITTGDRAGAGILTAVALCGVIGGVMFMISG